MPVRPAQAEVLADLPAPVFEYVAQTQSSRQVNIQARVDGFLDKRVYTEGSIVKAGQVLFLMDKKPFQAQVDAARAQVSKSQAAVDVAKANLDRVKPLAKAEALSQKDLDDATGNYESAQASLEAAKALLATIFKKFPELLHRCRIPLKLDKIHVGLILSRSLIDLISDWLVSVISSNLCQSKTPPRRKYAFIVS